MKVLLVSLFVLLFPQLQSIHIEDTTGIKSRFRETSQLSTNSTAYVGISLRSVLRPSLCLHTENGKAPEIITFASCSQNSKTELFYWHKDLTLRLHSNPGICITSKLAVMTPHIGDQLLLFGCMAATNQQWIVQANGQINSVVDPLVCFSGGGSVTPGDGVVLSACNVLNTDQLFFRYPTFPPQGHLVLQQNFKCAIVPSPIGGLVSGLQLQLGTCDSSEGIVNQRFYLLDDNTIRSTWNTELCLTAIGGIVKYSLIQLMTCSPNYFNQLWNMRSDGTIRSLYNPTFCFNSAGGTLVNGEKIIIYPCSAAPNEVFGVMLDGLQEEQYGSIRPNAKPSRCIWSDGISIALRTCSNNNYSPNELFIFQSYKLRLTQYPYQSKCFHVSNPVSGSEVTIASCSSSSTSEWYKWPDGTIRPIKFSIEGEKFKSPLCLQTDGNSIISSSRIVLGTCGNPEPLPNQVFFIVTN